MKSVERKTRETDVRIEMARGAGTASVSTGSRFLDHMITTLARYSGLDITVAAKGDIKHHLIEDVAIAAGSALAGVIPDACARYANRTIAMDDALVQAVLDAAYVSSLAAIPPGTTSGWTPTLARSRRYPKRSAGRLRKAGCPTPCSYRRPSKICRLN